MAEVRHLGRHSPELTAAVEQAAADLVLLLSRASGQAPHVSVSQLRALVVLRDSTAMNVTTLAEALGALPSSASRLCDRLAAAGLVERVTRSGDRREVTVQLTRDGLDVLALVEERRRADLHETLGGMTVRGRAQLLAGLAELSRVVAADRPVGAADVDHTAHDICPVTNVEPGRG